MLLRDTAGQPPMRAPSGFRRRGRPLATGVAVFLLLGMLYALVLFLSANGAGLPQTQLVALPPVAAPAATTLIYENGSALAQSNASTAAAPVDAADTPSATTTTNALALQISSNPATICADNDSSCPAGVNQARVTLSAQAINTPKPFWPDVQVAFILETTAYDGVFDHYNSYYGQDPCAAATDGQGPVCEESNGVPFFIQDGGAVAQAIQQNNPHSNVSFALVDFFGTDCGDWDDCGDGYKYHVDISTFISADEFGPAIHSTFQSEVLGGGWDGIFGLDDNFLHSPSITALYGTIIGSGLDWSPASHHVIVLIGSTAPRDPSYPENYYASAFDHCCSGSQADGWTCEPAYQFSNGQMPNCEGWVNSQDGNPNDSIAALAHTAVQCTESIGHVCTIDTIDLYDTATDPLSQGWPTNTGYPGSQSAYGPGGAAVIEDTDHVVLAGCALAAATGGTWDGPVFDTCPNGQAGTLQYVPHGALSDPDTNNPTLYAALKGIGFGPIYASLAANGTSKPLFQFVPFGGMKVASDAEFTAACTLPVGFLKTCQTVPTEQLIDGSTVLEWNWSTNATTNALYTGDVWTASFNVVNQGPPYSLVPVDACTTVDCEAGHSGPVNDLYTWATYRAGNNVSVVTQSFPLAVISVQLSASPILPPVTPPPAPVIPPSIPVLAPPGAVPVLTPTLQTLGIPNISLQATAAGFLGAGFTTLSVKNRPVMMKVASLSKNPASSKFDKAQAAASTSIGRFE
jgi:hypothetical protein